MVVVNVRTAHLRERWESDPEGSDAHQSLASLLETGTFPEALGHLQGLLCAFSSLAMRDALPRRERPPGSPETPLRYACGGHQAAHSVRQIAGVLMVGNAPPTLPLAR